MEYWEDVQGYIWTSENAGVTWTKRTSAGGKSWSQVTSSGDGTKIFALSDNSDGKIYKSSDSGDTWTESSGPSGLDADLYNYDISSSSNGKYLVVSNANGYLYTSNDSGATWIKQTSALSDFYWVEMSRNGKSIAAPIYGGLIWTGIRD